MKRVSLPKIPYECVSVSFSLGFFFFFFFSRRSRPPPLPPLLLSFFPAISSATTSPSQVTEPPIRHGSAKPPSPIAGTSRPHAPNKPTSLFSARFLARFHHNIPKPPQPHLLAPKRLHGFSFPRHRPFHQTISTVRISPRIIHCTTLPPDPSDIPVQTATFHRDQSPLPPIQQTTYPLPGNLPSTVVSSAREPLRSPSPSKPPSAPSSPPCHPHNLHQTSSLQPVRPPLSPPPLSQPNPTESSPLLPATVATSSRSHRPRPSSSICNPTVPSASTVGELPSSTGSSPSSTPPGLHRRELYISGSTSFPVVPLHPRA